ncbi:MAG: extracellular solute-binding protein [Clostridia bacterium]|nr:extracellular solute-binding protein [Clostridia bacterium]
MDKKKKKVVIWASVIGVLVIALAVFLIIRGNRKVEAKQFTRNNYDEMQMDPFTQNEERLKDKYLEYGKVLTKYSGKNISMYTGEPVYAVFDASGSKGNFSAFEGMEYSIFNEDGSTVTSHTIEADPQAIYYNGSGNAVLRFTVDVKEEAWYYIQLDYLMTQGKDTNMLLGIEINGEAPFSEAGNLELTRMYGFYSAGELDIMGNELRPKQQEYYGWQTTTMHHAQGLYLNPYRFYLQPAKEGEKVVITLTLSREAGVIKGLRLVAPEVIPTYEEYKAANSYSDSAKFNGEALKYELEMPAETNDMALRMGYDYNYASSPQAYELIHYNILGGDRWQNGGVSASWNFNVPETGWYQISFRYNTTLSYIVTYRDVEIDGKIPYTELQEYCFPYSDGWVCEPLKDANQKPYLVYLTAGEHTIRLTSKTGPLRHSLQKLGECIDSISEMLRKISQITGSSRSSSGGYVVDKNRDWDLDIYIPTIRQDLKTYSETLNTIYEDIKLNNGGSLPYYGSSVMVAKKLFDNLQKDIEDVPISMNEINDAITGISDTMVHAKEQPFMVDYMMISKDGETFKKARSNAWQNFKVNVKQFALSFTKDYSSIGATKESENATKEITVYVARGREYVNIMRNMIAESFTPETNIKVDLNMVAGSAESLIMLHYVAGTAPDVSISIGAGTPVEYAVRGALVPLNDMNENGIDDDQEEGMEWNTFKKLWKEDYLDNAFISYLHRGNYYAFPETQGWAAMFYRTDILDELEITPPETWEDLYRVLPRLQENNMDFYFPYGVGNYYPFLYQAGGSLYDEDGRRSALDTDAAYDAFIEYANLYIKYKLPYTASFYQRFRTGEMPLGIADLGFYCQISYAAPELADKWAMAPVPGHIVGYEEDGTPKVARYCGGNGTCAVIIKQEKEEDRQYEESWKFLEWWLSAETQSTYAQEVEATFGIASRWNPANKNALKNMAYSEDELNIIYKHWDDELGYMESPNVLGGYYTSRYLLTALNQAVVQGDSARIALEDAVKEINKEMKRKQDEFGITGSILKKN